MSLSFNSELIELKQLPDFGGGRGVVALVPLQPGQLLLLEQPIVKMPSLKDDDETLHFTLARTVLQHPNQDEVLQSLARLHPLQLTDLGQDVLTQLTTEHANDIDKLITLKGDKPTQEARDALLRLLLALRFNAHPSGIYLLSEMFNHACCPNAIKLATPHGSEIRAVKPITPGTQVTISYLDPPLQSFRRRCDLLRTQHFFTLQPPSDYPTVMEAWSDHAQGADDERQAQLHKCEEELDALERDARLATAKMQAAVNAHIAHHKQQKRRAKAASKSGAGADVSQAASQPILASLDAHPQDPTAHVLHRVCGVCRQAAALLHPRHIVLARMHELVILLCTALMSAWSEMPRTATAKTAPAQQLSSVKQSDGQPAGQPLVEGCQPEADPRTAWLPDGLDLTLDQATPSVASVQVPANPELGVEDVGLLLLRACLELRQTQELYTGPAHYDSARTLLDTQNCLEFLMSQCPKRLYAGFPKDFGNFSAASRAAHKYRTEHTRIAALYQ